MKNRKGGLTMILPAILYALSIGSVVGHLFAEFISGSEASEESSSA
jgi:hypothetical protein